MQDAHAHVTAPTPDTPTPDTPINQHSHGHAGCPHCPPEPDSSRGDDAGAHVTCSALADVAANGAPSSDLKSKVAHLLNAPAFERTIAPIDCAALRERAAVDRLDYSSPAIHLRHCVFVI